VAGALARTGGLGLPVLTVAVATGAALAIGLGAAASLRVLTVAILGRPRTPRMAGAEDAAGDGRRAMVGVVAAAVLAGLLPALLLRAFGPVVAVLSGVPTPEPLGLLALIPEADFQGYDAPLLAVLIAFGAAVATTLVRRGATATEAPAEAPVWDGGLMPSPWLPYGEPGAQVAPSALPRTIGWTLQLPPIEAWATERLARVRAGLAALGGDATPPRARSIRNGAGALLLVGIALLGVLVLVLSR
jgi:hydrogenase-4 component B